MNRAILYAAALLVLGFSAHEASAATTLYFDNFNTIPYPSALNTPPAGWTILSTILGTGTVDSINNTNTFGMSGTNLRCLLNTGGCVDLDGTSNLAGKLATTSSFSLIAGQTYALTAWVSGNQRGATPPDNLNFGFLNSSTDATLKSETINGITSSSPYTFYTLFFTPKTSVSSTLFFYDTNGTNNQGPMLDNVRLTDLSIVPLPAAAWLLLSGLAALGTVARRRTSTATA